MSIKVDPDLVRLSFLWSKFKKIIEDKWLTMMWIAEKMGTAHPSVINVLNGRKHASDKFFLRIWEAIWLSETEIRNIFKEADIEKYKHKYWEDLRIDPLEDVDFNFDVALRKEYWKEIDDATVQKIKDFIEHVRFLKKK